MSYLVTAPCVIAQDRDGKNQHRYEGDVISWLSADQAEHFLSSGLVEKANKGVGGSDPASDEDGKESASGDDKPLRAAPKADWVDYAVSKGADREEAEGLNKQELVDLYGG